MEGAGLEVMRRTGLVPLAALFAGRVALAAPCTSPQPEAGAPLRLGPGPAGLGTVPEACPANEVALHGVAAALIDEPDFYGFLNASVALRFRAELGEHAWASLQMPGLEYWYVANATVEAETTEMSAGALGLHSPWALSNDLQIAPYLRLLLPTETVYENAVRYGADAGTAALWRTHRMLELVGGVSVPLLITVNGPAAHTVVIPSLTGEAWFEPWTFVAAGAGLGIRARFGTEKSFDAVDPRAGLRFYFGGGTRLELGALFPLWGEDRTDLVLAASFGWLFEAGAHSTGLR